MTKKELEQKIKELLNAYEKDNTTPGNSLTVLVELASLAEEIEEYINDKIDICCSAMDL